MSSLISLVVATALGSSTDIDQHVRRTSGVTPAFTVQAAPQDKKEAAQDTPKPAEESEFDKAVKDHTKDEGAINTYIKGDTLLFEIPDNLLGRDFLWYITTRASSPGGYSGSALNEGVVRFEKRDDKILMRKISFGTRSMNGDDIKLGVELANTQPIIASLAIKATSDNKGYLVDASNMFIRGLADLRGGPQNIDTGRSYIERVVAFPNNVNVTTTITATAGAGASQTMTVAHSVVLLPEEPMKGRLADSRVGYFDYGFTMFDGAGHGAKRHAYISRYRLEKKDPSAAVSEPVKPIVYYLAREIPAKWRPYVKKGIEDWQPAFEAAGFKNAIIAMDAPDDPDWSEEDVRHSVVRWAPLPIANAMGPHVADPRSGEILSAHIIMWHDVLQLSNQWYFAQASPNDPRAQKLPFPDDLTGELLRFVVAHEVGHTLGLHHNGKSSAMVPVEKLRDKAWTEANGTAASIMDYARFNYIAQPGDGANLIPKLGVYDIFAIKWGYTPIDAGTSWGEKSILDAWAAKQVADPMLRFYNNFSSIDPTAQSEALGDDAVLASTYGVANLKRVMTYVPATATFGDDYATMNEYYGSVLDQFNRYVGHVISMVGGVETLDWHVGRGGAVFVPVPGDRQRAAVNWLMDNVVEPPLYLVPKSVVDKIGPGSGKSTMDSMSNRVWTSLLQDGRINRMNDNYLMNGEKAYTVAEMFADVRTKLWREFRDDKVTINAYRRTSQRSWVSRLADRMATRNSDVRAYVTAELKATKNMIDSNIHKSSDTLTRQHLADLSLMIDHTLRFPPQVSANATAFDPSSLFGADQDHSGHDHAGCSLMRPPVRKD